MQTFKFSAPQQAVLDAIAQGATKTAAAQLAGIHRDTIHHWEQTVAHFRDALLAAQATYREELATRLRRLSAKAIDWLEAPLDDPTTPPAVLFRAIQFVLTRPSFPQKECALSENLNPPAIQKMQQSMAIIEGDHQAARQHDVIHKMTVGNVGSTENARSVGSVGSVGSAGTPATALLDAHHFPPSRHVPFNGPTTGSHTLSETPQTPIQSETSDPSQPTAPPRRPTRLRQPARNHACPCGSGKKYKRCCGASAPPLLAVTSSHPA
ncbi:MAG: SEC-C domain-containing protein [Bryobacterales bacterium]|jgi:hypothetical protein|nr:SEC-C domain-containing protein [Bryobacterales bacterium]